MRCSILLLFYDVDDFLRPWEERDPLGRPHGVG
jgi:hypothetical protein